ncbi:hypothetical protein B0H14DRAFT_2440780 [Mycena olivaceomarginata]|nr:hypothetical protein B0H14DRAFT_2440780 [Mycena olivaceomarginata]
MYAFSSLDILKGAFDVAIARDGASWLLVTPKGNGFLETRQLAHLNLSTPATADPSSSSSSVASRFCRFWFDSDWDRQPTPWSDLLAALLTIEPKAPIKRTGQTRRMVAELGGEREAVEVEVLLDESELCKVCYYCGEFESTRLGPEEAYRKIGGEGYTLDVFVSLVRRIVICGEKCIAVKAQKTSRHP